MSTAPRVKRKIRNGSLVSGVASPTTLTVFTWRLRGRLNVLACILFIAVVSISRGRRIDNTRYRFYAFIITNEDSCASRSVSVC